MNMIDRIIITIFMIGALYRPTELDFVFGTLIIVVWLLWEFSIFIMFKWKRSKEDIELFKKLET